MNSIISINTLAYEGYDLTTALQEIAKIDVSHVELGFTRGWTADGCDGGQTPPRQSGRPGPGDRHSENRSPRPRPRRGAPVCGDRRADP